MGRRCQPGLYMAFPAIFEQIAQDWPGRLAKDKKNSRIVIEKPFGHIGQRQTFK